MRHDWVEFENGNGIKFSLRPEYIQAIEEIDDGAKLKNLIKITYDVLSNGAAVVYSAKGTYEQVKQKIIDAEKGKHNHGVESFNRGEYQRLLTLAKVEQNECKTDNLQGQVVYMQNIINKLNEILKENK